MIIFECVCRISLVSGRLNMHPPPPAPIRNGFLPDIKFLWVGWENLSSSSQKSIEGVKRDFALLFFNLIRGGGG